MARIDGRLRSIETVTGARQRWSGRDESYLRWLSTSSVDAIADAYAESKAHRRWLHDTGRVAGQRTPGGGWYMTTGHGWVWHTTEAERDHLVSHERRELETLHGLYEWHEALAIWTNEADARGWPMLWGTPCGYDEFMARVERDRVAMDSHRSASSDLAREWRRRNPAWHAGMTAADYDAWERGL